MPGWMAESLRQEADAHAGSDHGHDPVFAFAAEAPLESHAMLPTQFDEVIAILAVDA